MKKLTYHLVIALLALIVSGAVLGVSAQLSARDSVIDNAGSKLADKLYNESKGFGGDVFGSSGLTSTGTPALMGGFDSINLTGELRFGDNNTFTDEGIAEWLVVKDFTDATVTPVVFQNKYGENVYIRDLFAQVLGKATSTVRFCVTTSTAAFIARDDVTILAENAGKCTLLRAFNGFGSDAGYFATNTDAYISQYAGTNTYAANAQFPLLWKPDEYILVYATSSDGTMAQITSYSITGSDNTFSGELYVKLERVD